MYRTAFLPYAQLFFEYTESSKKNDMQVLQYHDCYEVYLMTAGERYLFFNGDCHILKPGDLFVVRPFEMHYTQSQDSPFYARYLLNFSEKQLVKFLTSTELNLLLEKLKSGIIHLTPEQYQEALFYLKGICHSSGFLAEKLQYSYLLQLLVLLARCTDTAEILSETPSMPDVKPEILQAIQYINRHYTEKISLEQIAANVHLSKYYFCRQFSKTTGATFLEYLNNMRLAKAHQLLLSTSLSIAEIAAKAGFPSSVQLSRVFFSVYKVTQTAFRKKAQAADDLSL